MAGGRRRRRRRLRARAWALVAAAVLAVARRRGRGRPAGRPAPASETGHRRSPGRCRRTVTREQRSTTAARWTSPSPGMRPHENCTLVAVDRDGDRHAAGEWPASDDGRRHVAGLGGRRPRRPGDGGPAGRRRPGAGARAVLSRSVLGQQQHLADVLAGLDQRGAPRRPGTSAAGGRRSGGRRRVRRPATRRAARRRRSRPCRRARSAGRDRSVVACTEARLAMSLPRSSSALVPPCMPMRTSRPPTARASTLRARYLAPMLSRMTSTPAPSVSSFTRSTKSSSR